MRLIKFLFIISLAFLTGCATLTPATSPTSTSISPSWPERRAALSRIQQWSLQGVIAVQTSRGADKAKVRWQQFGTEHFQMRIWGPLGAGLVKIAGKPNQVTLQNKHGTQTAISARALLQKSLGWNVPVQYMRYWVRGLPVPKEPVTMKRDPQQRVKTLHQADWELQYQAYRKVENVDLPTKITLAGAKTKIRIVIQRWTLA